MITKELILRKIFSKLVPFNYFRSTEKLKMKGGEKMADRPMLTQEQIADLVKDMSDNAKSFVQKLAAEESFQNKFASIKSAEEMLQITSAEGITISMEELKNIMLAASKTVLDTGSELSDDALERVAGGGSEDDYQYAQAAVAI